MSIETVYTDAAPSPIGPYSQAIRAGEMIFTAGQVALDTSGRLIGHDAASQARQALTNLLAVLHAAGASAATVVKTTIFLKDMNDFAAVNTAYQEFFGDAAPARSTVEVSRLPKDALVEIEAIAVTV